MGITERDKVEKKQSRHVGATVAQELKLKPHMVPKPLWGKSAANLLSHAAWDRIRADALEVAHQTCKVCSDSSHGTALICHELWDYDDENGTATLVGLRIQCRNCDWAVHMGRAVKKGYGDEAIAQLVKVNGIAAREARVLYRRAIDEWKLRNKKEWRIVVATALLERYPELRVLQAG